MDESWKDIPGYEGAYQVSNLGRVKSRNRILKSRDGDKQGHQIVRLSTHKRNEPYVHYLVLLAFVGERPPGLVCCHGDGDPKNNRLDNLRYDTQTNNNIDRLKSNRKMNPNSLSLNQVKEIRKLIQQSEMTHRAIAEKFEVSANCIWKINSGRTYSWLK